MTVINAKVIADSVSPAGDRLTTMEVTYHRFVHSELMTHRVFSRNAASSRAISFKKMLQRVKDDPAVPISFPAEKPGMQGGAELTDLDRMYAEAAWLAARDDAVHWATELHERGVHKSVCNRLLEPFAWMTVIVSSTEWENYFEQRVSHLAMPELHAAAEYMLNVLHSSTPARLYMDDYHTPYVDSQEVPDLEIRKKVSVARCCRVSYLNQDGVRDIDKDLALYARLENPGDGPPHMSPFEHVARPGSNGLGNFKGFIQLRHEVFGR